MDLDFELNLKNLWATADSKVSPHCPQKQVEVVVDPNDRSKGFIVVDVRGFLVEDGKPLRRAYNAAVQAYQSILGYETKRHTEINPLGDECGKLLAESIVESEISEWRGKALSKLIEAARHICFLGVVGYAPGMLTHKGQAVDFSTEERELLGKKRSGLATHPLAILEASLLSIRLARFILDISAGSEAPPKEKQWKGEAPEQETPLPEAHVTTP